MARNPFAGQELLLRALLAKGASCLQQDAFERSALHVAALVGDEAGAAPRAERWRQVSGWVAFRKSNWVLCGLGYLVATSTSFSNWFAACW